MLLLQSLNSKTSLNLFLIISDTKFWILMTIFFIKWISKLVSDDFMFTGQGANVPSLFSRTPVLTQLLSLMLQSNQSINQSIGSSFSSSIDILHSKWISVFFFFKKFYLLHFQEKQEQSEYKPVVQTSDVQFEETTDPCRQTSCV